MAKAVIFDFGRTLVDSAGAFRTAEREAQDRIFAALEGVERDRFMDVYRRVRKAHHERSRLSRREIWRSVYDALERSIDLPAAGRRPAIVHAGRMPALAGRTPGAYFHSKMVLCLQRVQVP